MATSWIADPRLRVSGSALALAGSQIFHQELQRFLGRATTLYLR
jgi:hypothetical protein